MTHRATDVGNRRRDLLKDWRPAGVSNMANQNVTVTQTVNLVHRHDYPGYAIHNSIRSGESLDHIRIGLLSSREPRLEIFPCDAPEHDNRGVVNNVRHWPKRGRGLVFRPLRDCCLPLIHNRHPVGRAAWWRAI